MAANTVIGEFLRGIARAVQGIRRFYGQPDGWPLKVEAAYQKSGYVILACDFQRRKDHLLRAECPEKIRRRFGQKNGCDKRQWIAFDGRMSLDQAAASGRAWIKWSDKPTWLPLTTQGLATLDLEA